MNLFQKILEKPGKIICRAFFMGGLIPPSPTSPSFSLSKGEGAVLQIFNEHHTYHINFISLFIIFEETDNYQKLRKAWAVPGWPSPLEKVGMRPSAQHFRKV